MHSPALGSSSAPAPRELNGLGRSAFAHSASRYLFGLRISLHREPLALDLASERVSVSALHPAQPCSPAHPPAAVRVSTSSFSRLQAFKRTARRPHTAQPEGAISPPCPLPPSFSRSEGRHHLPASRLSEAGTPRRPPRPHDQAIAPVLILNPRRPWNRPRRPS